MVQISNSSRYVPKNIYLISDPSIAKGYPHHRICMNVDAEGTISFACCTSKGDARLENIKRKKWDEKTLVKIDHTSKDNQLTDPTHVDCNTVSHFSEDELNRLSRTTSRIVVTGKISDKEYEQLLKGFLASDQIDGYFMKDCNDILNP